MKRFFILLAIVALFGAMTLPSYVHADKRASDAQAHDRPETAPDEYFVAFRDAITENDNANVRATGARINGEFPEVRAVAVKVRNEQQLAALQRNPRVEYIEAVPMRYKMGLSSAEIIPTASNGLYGLLTTKSTLVHSRTVPITGTGINVGVADTSLDTTHPDIIPNYRGGVDTVGTAKTFGSSPNVNDGETHGTHVAGTILAANDEQGVYGVAYTANLYHARVLGPNGGSSTDIMEGVRWLVESAGCKIVNLSLGGGRASRTEENFYKEMRNKGALVVAATGNDGATKVSYPAAYAVNIAVGAVDKNNVIASFSNKGSAIDVVAPGVGVLSSVRKGTGSESSVTNDIGTSYTSFGMEYASKTAGTKAILVDCGLGRAGECPTVSGNIALIQRGEISFADKVTNAMNQGAIAAIIYNNTAGDFSGTLGAATTSDGRTWIPAVTVSDITGAALVNKVGTSATVFDGASDWDYYDGTSMATPHAAGVLALIWSANQGLSANTVESYLFSTATDLGAAGFDSTYGRGIVNADAAVAKTGK